MRMLEEALLLELAHGVADRGWGDAESVAAGDDPRAGWFRGLDVPLDHRLENAALPRRQLVCDGHKSKYANDFGDASRQRRVRPAAAIPWEYTGSSRRRV